MIRVVHVIAALGTGGAERQLESLVSHSGAGSRTIALYGGGPVADAMTGAGHRVDVLGMSGSARFTALPRLARAIRRARPDVVHVHLLAGQLWGIPAARLARVPVVLSSEHSLMEDSIENRPLTTALRATYLVLERMATHTVAVSRTTRDRLVRWGVRPERITVVDNGIDFACLGHSEDARREVRSELGIPSTATVVGAVGRLEEVKRPAQLLAALAPTLAAGERHLVLVGDGELRERLARQSADLGVADAVHITGSRGDVAAVLSAMDVVASCSRDETFGMAVVEALGNGLPVVFAQCPALDELSSDLPGAVRLIPADDSDAAEASAVRAAVDRALAGGRLPLPADLQRRYDIGQAARRIDALYARLAH